VIILSPKNDETLPIMNKPKHPKRGNTMNKMEGPTSKKMKEPAKRVYHKGNIKFPNSLSLREAYQIKKGGGPLERRSSLEELSPIATSRLKIKIACARWNIIDTLKMCANLRKEGFQCLSLLMSC
jgi:hypothetical protein